MNLHILSKNLNTEALQDKLNCLGEKDACLLRNDAAFILFNQSVLTKLLNVLPSSNLFVLEEDLASRGLTFTNESIKKVNYNQFVALCLQFEKTISW